MNDLEKVTKVLKNVKEKILTKADVGLSLVENFGVANKAEAEAGTATNKYMTPIRVFEAIAKWTQGKFVGKTGDEDVAGVKNFTSVPQINNIPVAVDRGTAFREITMSSSIDGNISGGFIRLWRIGNIVVIGIYITVKGNVRWINLGEYGKGFEPSSTGSFGLTLASTDGNQYKCSLYSGSGNFRMLTQTGMPTSEISFSGTGVYVTESAYLT